MSRDRFFQEMSFFTLGSAAGNLGTMFDEIVSMANVETKVCEDSIYTGDNLVVKITFTEGSENKEFGTVNLIFEKAQADVLVKREINRLFGANKEVTEEYRLELLNEIANILAGNMMEALNISTKREVGLKIPEISQRVDLPVDDSMIRNQFEMSIGDSDVVVFEEVAPVSFYEMLVEGLKKRI